ncbi:LysR family transcriptional regulator [Granulosicoccaceae sp. 1_MG-2023]|nr:LysR family transcriptional regulator [Granulosicoccaceae sp. 1_MG-2023]
MSPTLKQLQHFIVLAEELHFGRAAQRLNISQPPLSNSLKQLEQQLGFQLMERSRRSVRLTEAGAIYAVQARRVLEELETARNMAWQAAHGGLGTISVGFVPSMLFRRLPDTLRRFEQQCPGIALHLFEQNTNAQLEGVLQHRIDVGFIHAVSVPPELEVYELEIERMVCCVPTHHRLARKSRISLEELVGERVILFSRQFAEHYFDRMEALLNSHGIALCDDFHVQHWLTVVALVANGLGVSLVPQSLAQGGFSGVAYVELADATAQYPVSMVWNKRSTNPAVENFVAFVRGRGSAAQ